jgi:tagatose-1,6-bisphosphate aldolase
VTRIGALTGPDGLVIGAAADHRDSLRIELSKRGLEVSDQELGQIKARVAEVIAPAATVILLDGEVGAPAARAAGVLGHGLALVLPLEAQGYGDVASIPETRLLPGFSPALAVEQGASGCKLLLPFRVDVEDQAERQVAVAAGAAEACRAAGIPLVLEPIVYRRGGEDLAADAYGELVIAGAARLAQLEPGVLKLQHPGNAELCRGVHEACAGEPWVLLGGGADEDTLERQIAEACAAGAVGFIVGRTLWSDALVPDPAERERILSERPLARLQRLAAAARAATSMRQA